MVLLSFEFYTYVTSLLNDNLIQQLNPHFNVCLVLFYGFSIVAQRILKLPSNPL